MRWYVRLLSPVSHSFVRKGVADSRLAVLASVILCFFFWQNARACDTRNSELLANNDRLLTESKKLSSHCADAFARDVVNEDRQSCKEFGQNTSHFATFVNGLEEKLKLCEESRPTTASRLGYCILPFLTFLAGWLYRWHLIILSWGWWILRKFFLEVRCEG